MMKFLPLVALALPFTSLAGEMPKPLPCDKEGKVLPKVVTAENFTLTNAQVLAKFADGLLLKVEKCAPPTGRMNEGAKDSVMLIPFESLPGPVVIAVGGFKAADAEAARQLREEAMGKDGKQTFDKALVGSFPVMTYVSASADVFGMDAGKAQTWEEYEAARAKLDKEAKKIMDKHSGKKPERESRLPVK